MPMDGTDDGGTSEFQRALALQIDSYETQLDGLRRDGGEPVDISTFEVVVAELRRLQLEDLAELARIALRRAGPAVA